MVVMIFDIVLNRTMILDYIFYCLDFLWLLEMAQNWETSSYTFRKNAFYEDAESFMGVTSSSWVPVLYNCQSKVGPYDH